jgi:hypothetical protein
MILVFRTVSRRRVIYFINIRPSSSAMIMELPDKFLAHFRAMIE